MGNFFLQELIHGHFGLRGASAVMQERLSRVRDGLQEPVHKDARMTNLSLLEHFQSYLVA